VKRTLGDRIAIIGVSALGAAVLLRQALKKNATPAPAEPATPPAPGAEPSSAPAAAPPTSTLTPEEIMGKPEFLFPGMAGYTRAIPVLPPEANSFARQGLSKPYGAITGPSVLSDGKTYIAVTESHLDDHVTNPKTGLKDKHWHKGVSMLMKTG